VRIATIIIRESIKTKKEILADRYFAKKWEEVEVFSWNRSICSIIQSMRSGVQQ
jgi:hypothetical protein